MVRRLSRKTLLSRLLTACFVVAFTASLTGVGGASPVSAGSEETTATVPPAPSVPEAEAPEQEPPAEQTAAEPHVPDPLVEPQEDVAPEPGDESTSVSAAPSAVTPAASGPQLTFQGYRSDQAKWTTGNLGQDYAEGDWVTYRAIIDNSGSATPFVVTSLAFTADHCNSTKNAAGADKTKDWSYKYQTSAPGTGDPSWPTGLTSVTPAQQDVPYPSGAYGSSQYLRTTLNGAGIVVPANRYAVVYFRTHLSLTAYWLGQTPPRYGSGYFPGASMHHRVDVSGLGDKTVPIPVPPRPAGSVNGFKFNDLDRDGAYDAGEPGLGGWVFHLSGTDPDFPIDVTATSAADGTFVIDPLPDGTYYLDEDAQPGWSTEYVLPLTVVVSDGQAASAEVGNYVDAVTKTFSLDLDSLVSNVGLYVKYRIGDGGTWTGPVPLSGSGPYTGSVQVPYGTNVTGVQWWATFAGEDVLLYEETIDETLTEDFTNPGEYGSLVSGHKFEDLDADGEWDDAVEPGLGGWEITLWRDTPSGAVVYDVTTTGPGGYYEFVDVIPGTYRVTEDVSQAAGWYNTVAPEDDIVIPTGGDEAGDLDFGNVQVLSDIDVTKTGPDKAHVGDAITYTIVVTNTGATPLTDVVVYDPLFDATFPGGIIDTIPVLAPGAARTYYVQYEVPDEQDGIVSNTVLASGQDLFGDTKSDTADWDVVVIRPAVSVDKTVDFDGDGTFGDSETYYAGAAAVWKIVVSNAGDSDLFGVTVDDSNGMSLGPWDLAVGESVGVTYTTTVEADTVNTAVAEAYDELEEPCAPASDEAEAIAIAPSFTVKKYVDFDADGTYSDGSETYYAGSEAKWMVVVENTGDSALTVVLSDSNGHSFGAPFALGPADPPAVFTYSTFPLADTVDTVTAQVTDVLGGLYSDTDSAEVLAISPSITVEKTSDAPVDGVMTGSTVVYTFTVTNGADPLTDVQLVDAILGFVHDIGDLAPGQTVEVSTSAVLEVPTDNVVVVEGLDELDNEVSDEDELFVDVFSPFIVDIGIDKEADRDTAEAGAVVTYTLTYTNTGGSRIMAFTIVDDFDERYVTVTDAAGGDVVDGTIVWEIDEPLDVGASGSITYEVRIRDDMPSGTTNVDNVVVVRADGDENPDNDRATERVVVAFLPFTPNPDPAPLPFTGGDAVLLGLALASTAALGVVLRRRARRAA